MEPVRKKRKLDGFKRQTLLEEIQSILQKYPDDGQIFKELIQNAEDANASEIVFLYDQNEYGGNNFSVDGLKKFQGPSLYAYNNGFFEDQDWDGIRSLGTSNKIKDPLKVGRFGLGFKSVFHLTDLPTISSGFCQAYLDPSKSAFTQEVQYYDFEEDHKILKKDDLQCFKSLPGRYSLREDGYCDGTLFRFPLRKSKSPISSLCYDQDKIVNLIDTFKNEASMNLIFLKKILSIKFYVIPSGCQNAEELYSVSVTENCAETYGGKRQNFLKHICESTIQKNFGIEKLNHRVDIEEKSNGTSNTHSYVLSELFGYDNNDQFRKMITDEELSYIPLVSVAFSSFQRNTGHVFCCLPLPLREKCMTGLPVNVNGYFALGQDRKDLKWKTLSAKQVNDKSVLWNENLIEKLLPNVYCNLIEYLIESGLSDDVYSVWPSIHSVNEKWKLFLNPFIDGLQHLNCIYVPSKEIWVSMSDALFLRNDGSMPVDQYSALKVFLTNLKLNIVCVPDHVLEICKLHKASIVTKMNIQENLKAPEAVAVFKKLTSNQQCHILSYVIEDDEDLCQLCELDIFKLVGDCYGKISQASQISQNHQMVYLPTDDHPGDLLPTQDRVIDVSFYTDNTCFIRTLEEGAKKGIFNLILLNEPEVVIKAIKATLPVDWDNDDQTVEWCESHPNDAWLKRIWEYQHIHSIPIDQLDGMHLIPFDEKNKRCLNIIMQKPLLMLSVDPSNDHPIDKEMKSFLQQCQIKFVDKMPKDIAFDLQRANRILVPIVTGYLSAICNVAERFGDELINRALVDKSNFLRDQLKNAIAKNAIAKNEDRCLQKMITNNVLLNLKVFRVYNCDDRFTSLNSLYLVERDRIPSFLFKYIDVVEKESIPKNLVSRIKADSRYWGFEQVAKFLVVKHYGSFSSEDKKLFSLFVLQYLSKKECDEELLYLLKRVVCVESDGENKPPAQVYEKTEELSILFYGEHHKFPDNIYEKYLAAMKKLGLISTTCGVSQEELNLCINSIADLRTENLHALKMKVKKILEVSITKGFNLLSFADSPWIPIEKSKPRSYPKQLILYGTDTSDLQTPREVYSKAYTNLVGSSGFIANSSIDEEFSKAFPNQHPSPEKVCSHLKIVINSYNDEERGLFKEMLTEVYNHMSVSPDDFIKIIKDQDIKIWHDNNFVEYRKILLADFQFDVKPYFFKVTERELPESFVLILKGLGCDKHSEIDIYISVLKEMMKKYNDCEVKMSTDVDVSVDLIEFIANRFHELQMERSDIRREICVPIDSTVVRFCPLSECFFHDFNGRRPFSSASSCNVLHRAVKKSIADKLEIPNLLSKVLSGDDELFESWGQHEALTLRLKRLLNDYEDGMAIPKELIQNADDAKATKVFLLYDERQNNDLKSSLINPDMNNWQGPALWVFNDAQFSQEDFNNITRLNAGTKEHDCTKIGKFGLGFSAVYHLTDVPSFISGNTMVIFDPHTTYLGDAVKDKTKPGLKITLSKSKQDLVHFNDQFKVYHKVFGAKLDFSSGDVETFNGTLFRLPLRNGTTAASSDIKKLAYDNYEMRMLLNKVKGRLDHLLLFTQHVKSFECYHLQDGTCPEKMELLFSSNKVVESSSSQVNPLKSSSNVIAEMKSRSFSKIPKIRIFQKLSITVFSDSQKKIVKWLSSSCNGGEACYNYAIKKEGYNPCGGVALQYEDVGMIKPGMIKPLVDLNERFIFCFLPLPQMSGLPVHVNGAFEVSKDRRQLLQHPTGENKYGNDDMEWNDMLGMDIAEAYLNLLLKLKMYCEITSLKDWFSVLPSFKNGFNECISHLVQSLLSKILNGEEELFPMCKGNNNTWHEWSNVVILSEDLKKTFGPLAIQYLNWFYKVINQLKVCLDIPEDFLLLLQKLEFEQKLQGAIINDQFYIHFFNNAFHGSSVDTGLRNNIIDILIPMAFSPNYAEYNIKESLSQLSCIPTKPNGNLKKPSQLVCHRSTVSMLFDVNDEVFLCEQFQKHSEHLKLLGMNDKSLTWPLILDRAKIIESKCTRTKKDLMMERSEKLVNVISGKLSNNEKCPDTIESSLLRIHFLIVKQRPVDSIFQTWHGDGQVFAPPCDIYLNKFSNIACCSVSLLKMSGDEKLIDFLKLTLNVPSICHVRKQIGQLKNSTTNDAYKLVMEDIYEFLLGKMEMEMEIRSLSDLRIVYTENGELVHPSSVYGNIDQEIPKFMYKLPQRLKDTKYRPLMKLLGVQLEHGIHHYARVLIDIKEKFENQCLSEKLMKPILRFLIPTMCEDLNKDTMLKEVYIPDSNGVLKHPVDLCFQDVPWLPEDNDVCYAHTEIATPHCIKLGVKPLRYEYFQSNSIGLEFGQHEELCTRIKNLLQGYSQVEDVLNEILQNADDAGAKEIEFILDPRQHNLEKVFSEEWKPLQGPALLVCNDGVFTKSDLEGIQSLGKSNKSTNPLKTGKYGVGFNAVYQITDCPSFLTSIAGENDVLCIFDPNLLYCIGATPAKPGRMFTEARNVLNTYSDVQSAFLVNEYNSEGKTLFRFPLRNEKMAQTSKLSEKSVTVEVMERNLNQLKRISTRVLLFLNSVSSVTFTIIDRNGKVKDKDSFTLFSYEAPADEIQQFKDFQKTFISGNVHSVLKDSQLLKRNVCIQHIWNNTLKQVIHMNLVEQCGFSWTDSLDPIIVDMVNQKKLALVPKGGVACLSKNRSCENCENLNKSISSNSYNDLRTDSVFCTLPLPVESGLPLLVNGHFVLDYETRRNLRSYNHDTKKSDKVVWNKAILTNCILPCYIQFLLTECEKLKDKDASILDHIQNFYKKFPVINSKGTGYWYHFKKAFYKRIQENQPLLIVHRNSHVECLPRECFYLYHEEKPDLLLNALKQALVNVDIVPSTVAQSFIHCLVPLDEITPEKTRGLLIMKNDIILPKNPCNVNETAFQTEGNLLQILNYCFNDKSIGFIEGLPLCFLANKKVAKFSVSDKKFLTEYGELIKGSEELFVHVKVWKTFYNRTERFNCFKEFTHDDFSKLLETVLPSSKFKNVDKPILFDESCIDEEWLEEVWRYLAPSYILSSAVSPEGIYDWSLLLCQQKDKKYLVPIRRHKSVLHLENTSSNIVRILRKNCNVFETFHLPMFSGSLYENQDLINSLCYAYQYCGFENVTPIEACEILCWLNNPLQAWASQSIKKLPLFKAHSGCMVNGEGRLITLASSDIPPDALNKVEKRYNCKLLSSNGRLTAIYQKLGFSTISVVNLYKDYIFDVFPIMDDNEIYKHMCYVKQQFNQTRYLLDSVFGTNDFKIFHLQVIPFIPIYSESNQRQLKRAKELYDPHVPLFKSMLNPNEFPPKLFCSDDWLTFLRNIGLTKELSEEILLKFAKSLETEENVEKAVIGSKLLCKELFQHTNIKRSSIFYEKIRSIKFIVPNKMSNPLETIHRSKNSELEKEMKKICFENSTHKINENLVWTSMDILPDYAFVGRNVDELHITVDELHIKHHNLEFSKVFEHIEKITENAAMKRISNTCRIIPQEVQNDFKRVMALVYDYLGGIKYEKDKFENIGLILVDNDTKLEIPSKSVLLDQDIIRPYLNLVSIKNAHAFETFKILGCSEKPTALHYLKVIEELHQQSQLSPNQIKALKTAVVFLARTLKTCDVESLKSSQLYLPTVSFQADDGISVVNSTEAIYVDALDLRRRLQQFNERVLLMKYDEILDEKNETNANLIKYLPENMKPKVLSGIVHEELDVTCVEVPVADGHIGEEIKARFKSTEFLKAIARLVKHDQKNLRNTDDVEDLVHEIAKTLQSVQVKVYENLKSCFIVDGRMIEGSTVSKQLFLKLMNDDNLLQICFSNTAKASSDIYSTITMNLLSIFKEPIKSTETILLVPVLLEKPISEIHSFLDEKGVFNDASDYSFLDYGADPIPGDFVPLELYAILSNDFDDLVIGDYVAMEINVDGEYGFVYVIIRGVDGNTDKFQRSYQVQVSEDANEVKDVEYYRLFPFKRLITESNQDKVDGEPMVIDDETDSRTYEEIVEEIQTVLANISDANRLTIVRRLYLRWHPDKNPDHMLPLVNKVFHFIKKELKRLGGFDEIKLQHFNERASHESKSYREYCDSFKSRRTGKNQSGRFEKSTFKVPPTHNVQNPQPVEARRWFKQAKFDLEACMNQGSFNEWTCFLAHQAAEKALKAAKYRNHYYKCHSHDLVRISFGLPDNLQTPAAEMERLARSSAHLRYPNCWQSPGIPHSEYDASKADRAKLLAKQIVDTVEDMIEA